VRARLALAALCAACTTKPPALILNYHSVGETSDDYQVSRTAFAQQLDWLGAQGFHAATLNQLVEHRLPPRPVILTFDDGKEDALRVVLPLLQARGLRGTFFIITSLVGKPGYLSWDGVRALAAAGMEIGSHTVDHARLADLPDDRVRAELIDSKRELEAQLHAPVEALAYPYNSVRARVVDAARAAGYRAAVAGAAHGSANVLALYRFPVNGVTTLKDLERAAR
jgi:peptidoglycan/xylan/chitin deacetylase (PgdA/CDA1 family)